MQPLCNWQKYGNRLWSVYLMRYRGGSEGSREVFSIRCHAVESLSQKKGDALIIALKGNCGLFCRALFWTEAYTEHGFEVSKCRSFVRSFQRSQHHLHPSSPSLCRKSLTKSMQMPGCLVEFRSHPVTLSVFAQQVKTAILGLWWYRQTLHRREENGQTVELCWFTGALCSPANVQVEVAFFVASIIHRAVNYSHK